ncbi:hypothetical protein BJX64DRAFT_55162 [Aspergillus heterothallicus]
MESGTDGARLEDTRSHSPARRSPHLALISVRTVKRAAGIIPLAKHLPKITTVTDVTVGAGLDLKLILKRRWQHRYTHKLEDGRQKVEERERFRTEGKRRAWEEREMRRNLSAFSTPAMRAKRRQPGVSSPNQSPAPHSQRPQAACVMVYPPWAKISLHLQRCCDLRP